jgi:hypothetical protein
MEIQSKVCPKCENSYPATTEYFYRDSYTISGLSAHCKACRKLYYEDWCERNVEKVRQYHKNYQQSEKYKIYRKGYENSEKRLNRIRPT